jgi:flavin-dependent dehydrogenase
LSLDQRHTDYLVAGAGPAGLTAARLLVLKGFTVRVVDPRLHQAKRLELLAPASLGTVAALGLAPLLQDPAIARPCLGIRRRWGSATLEYEDFLRHPYRTGYVVDRARFDQRLRAEAAAAGVEFCHGRVMGVWPDAARALIRTVDGSSKAVTFSAAVIDATGRAAMIARRMGARVTIRDRMVAELIEETIDGGNRGAAAWLDVERTSPNWSYSIKGPDGRAQKWTIARSGTAAARSSRSLRVDASSGILSEAAGERWIAVGDAAISFDPISSQGLYNALSSALVATGALVSAAGVDAAAARLYSDAVAATFHWSEAGRSEIYRGLKNDERPQPRLHPTDSGEAS